MKIKRLTKYIGLICFIGLAVHLSIEPLFTPTALSTPTFHSHFPRYIAHKSLVSQSNVSNSLESIQEALASNIHGIEIDVRLSQDNIPFIFHGEMLEDTTNGSGAPEAFTLNQLQKLTYNGQYQTNILSLEDVFKIVGSQKYIFLDVKDSKIFDKNFVQLICKLIRKYHLQGSVIVESFNPVFLTYMRLESRDIMLMYDFTTDTKASLEESQSQFDKIPWLLKQPFIQKQIRRIVRPDILGPRWNIEEQYLKSLIDHGYPIIAWTVDDIDIAKKLFNLGVKGVETNQPLELMTAISHDSQIVYDAGGSNSLVQKLIHVKKEQDVLDALLYAKAENKKITIAGRRHSMGGQTLLDDTIHLDMLGLNHVIYNDKDQNITVGAGATWKKIQNILDMHGRSVSIMQSDNIFTVGGSISANVHGWQVGSPPISSTLISMRVLTPDGQIRKVSKLQNSKLFSAIIGGYGQFGVILEAVLTTVPNSLVQFKAEFINPKNFETKYRANISNNPNVELAYGRLSVDQKYLFEEAGLFWFEKTQESTTGDIKQESIVAFKRAIFRMGQYSDLGKKLRWYSEKKYAMQQMDSGAISRNNAMNADIHILWPLYGNNKDILQEYFIPKHRLNEFLIGFKKLILDFEMNILNVTIREVNRDSISLLPYAKEDMFGLVCLFSQMQTTNDEKKMDEFTKKVIDEVLKLDGSFYLPYRLHYTKSQLLKSYPNIQYWIDFKNELDPGSIFDSQFFQFIKK